MKTKMRIEKFPLLYCPDRIGLEPAASHWVSTQVVRRVFCGLEPRSSEDQTSFLPVYAILCHEKKNQRERKAGGRSMAAKSTTTIRQVLSYQPQQAAWFAATQALFNQVVAFYFEVIQAHEKLLDLNSELPLG
jgi:hypothetical protein